MLESHCPTNEIEESDVGLRFDDASTPLSLQVIVKCCRVQLAFVGTLCGVRLHSLWFVGMGPVSTAPIPG